MSYVCIYCGVESSYPDLAGRDCENSPTGGHVITSGKTMYVCKYCGWHSSYSSSANWPCQNSPTGKHVIME